MSESTTGEEVDNSVAENSSTTEPTTSPAEQTVQDVSVKATQATDNSAGQNNRSDDEAALAKFAKGQGIEDLSDLSDRERSLLKMARDNKSNYDKSKQSKLDESSKDLANLGDDATDIQRLTAKVADMEFENKKSKFFDDKDASLEPIMAKVVSDKRKEFGDDYARSLLSDLPTLYTIALSQKSTDKDEAIRQEERTSMNKSLAASSNGAQATSSKPQTPVKVTSDWIRNEYDPNNPEHRALVDAATKI